MVILEKNLLMKNRNYYLSLFICLICFINTYANERDTLNNMQSDADSVVFDIEKTFSFLNKDKLRPLTIPARPLLEPIITSKFDVADLPKESRARTPSKVAAKLPI